MSVKMKCPSCKSELIVGGQARLETLSEHVCNPNDEVSFKDFYNCSNPDCDCAKLKVMWDEWGGYYSGKSWEEARRIKFVDNNDGAFGSIERQMNVEYGKHDEDFYLPKIFGWRLKVEHKYKSNEDGDILSRKLKLILLHNGEHRISGIRMLIYKIKCHYRKFEKDNEKDFEYPKYDWQKKDLWRWIAPFILRIIDRKTFLQNKQV